MIFGALPKIQSGYFLNTTTEHYSYTDLHSLMEKTLRTNEQKRMAINVVKDQENYLTPVPCIFYYFVQ